VCQKLTRGCTEPEREGFRKFKKNRKSIRHKAKAVVLFKRGVVLLAARGKTRGISRKREMKKTILGKK